MPVQIGAKTHHFTDPTGLLSDCHRRIETCLSTLAAVADVIDQPLSEHTALSLQAALKYFREAAPKHTADEEESLFPRLRERNKPEVVSALRALDDLERDHDAVSPLHAEVERLGAQYLSIGSLSASDCDTFRTAIKKLQSMYADHIRVEDTVIFPLAARVLSQEEKTVIAGEMAGRRNVSLTPNGAQKGQR
jgi:iron-sulfur cluster repair protein YtfE (RIC family)